MIFWKSSTLFTSSPFAFRMINPSCARSLSIRPFLGDRFDDYATLGVQAGSILFSQGLQLGAQLVKNGCFYDRCSAGIVSEDDRYGIFFSISFITVTAIFSPGLKVAICPIISAPVRRWSYYSVLLSRSPFWMPAWAAAPSGVTSITYTPSPSLIPCSFSPGLHSYHPWDR